MSKFPDSYRAAAVTMLQSEGYPNDPFAIGRVHEYLKQKQPCPTKTTLKNWFDGKHNPPPSNVLDDKKKDMATEFKAIIWKLVAHAQDDETVSEMSGQQAITSIGILVDKLRLLEDQPTEISEQRHSGNIKLTTEERNNRIAEILESARNRGTGLSAHGGNNTDVH